MNKKQKFFASLGLISANFQCLEKYMEFLAWGLIGDDQEIGQIVTSQMSFIRLCDLLSSLIRYRSKNPELVKELDEIIKKASEVEEARNKVIHSCWFGDLDTKILRVKITAKGKVGLKHQYEHMEPEDLYNLGRSIKQVWETLLDFMNKLEAEGIITPTNHHVITPPLTPAPHHEMLQRPRRGVFYLKRFKLDR